jgi:hypothetical protein
VGGRGWLGVRLDGDIDWDEVTAICREAFSMVAPKKLLATLDLPASQTTANRRSQHPAASPRAVGGVRRTP